jgi:hypothetical protein
MSSTPFNMSINMTTAQCSSYKSYIFSYLIDFIFLILDAANKSINSRYSENVNYNYTSGSSINGKVIEHFTQYVLIKNKIFSIKFNINDTHFKRLGNKHVYFKWIRLRFIIFIK